GSGMPRACALRNSVTKRSFKSLTCTGWLFQKMFSSLSTAMTIFSGFVCVGIFFAFGRSTGTTFTITGMVIRKMMRSTSITSTKGVVLMVVFSSASPESGDCTLMDIDYSSFTNANLGSLFVGDEIGLQVARKTPELLVDDLVAADEEVVEEHG